MSVQLPLPVLLRDDAVFDNFFVAQNVPLISLIKDCIIGVGEPFIYFYGESGVGKTHLLQACCHLSDDQKNIFYISLKEHAELSPLIFEALEEQHVICIDDIDAIAGNAIWEEALFHFYNRSRDNHRRLIMSAKNPPKQLHFLLKDLQSRLQLGLVMELKSLSDSEKTIVLQNRAKARGLILSTDVLQYCMHHYSRNMQDLFLFLDKLDHASLIEKRKITVPFVKYVLNNGY